MNVFLATMVVGITTANVFSSDVFIRCLSGDGKLSMIAA
jgi:hypothetical protein